MAVAAILCGCGSKGNIMKELKKDGYTQMNNSMFYKVSEEAKDGKEISEGLIVLGTATFRYNDSVLDDITKVQPICMAQQGQNDLDFSPVMIGRHVGDHITVAVLADSVAKKFGPQALPPMYKEGTGDKMYYDFVITDALTQAEMQSKIEAEGAAAKNAEVPAREKYLKDNNINVKPSSTGLYRIITEQGSGKTIAKNSEATVHYTGRLLDGTVFDSSVPRNQPFTVTVGAGQVIPGWEEGLLGLKEGAKATLIIPSELAYGARGAGRDIPPYSTIVFDIEVISVK